LINIGVIGLGKMGLLHSSILNTMQDTKIVAICEKQPIVRLFAKRMLPSINVVSDLEEMRSQTIDAYYVTASVGAHYPIIKEIYTSLPTRHIFVEKPLCISSVQSREICGMSVGHSGTSMVGYTKRFSATFKKAHELIKSGILGDIVHVTASAFSSDFNGTEEFVPQGYARGGVLCDLGCHAIDLLHWLIGTFAVKTADVLTRSHGRLSYVDEAQTVLQFNESVEGSLTVSWCRENYRLPQVDIEVRGTTGKLLVNEYRIELVSSDERTVMRKNELETGVPFFLGESDYYREDQMFINAVRSNKTVDIDFAAACRTDVIINEILAKAEAREAYG
jgi:predicted dehydrogenase